MIDLVRATRELPGVQIGASVRGSLALERGARALALLEGRDHVEPRDIELLVEPVLSHRLLLTPAYALADEDVRRGSRSLLERCLERAPRPAPRSAEHELMAARERGPRAERELDLPADPVAQERQARHRRPHQPAAWGGSEIASSRPYRRGDAVRLVDWRASARLSTARGSDEFVVRDRFAEDVVRVLLIVDRSPSMALFPTGSPVAAQAATSVREAGRMILAERRGRECARRLRRARARRAAVERPGRDRGAAAADRAAARGRGGRTAAPRWPRRGARAR